MGVVRVLHVEDSVVDAALVERELQRLAFSVAVTRVETEVAMRAAIASAPIDLVISDWSMPAFSGERAMSVLRELASDVPFLIVSGTVGEEVAVEAMRTGANDFVQKENLRRLGPVIERELRDREGRIAGRLAEQQLRDHERRFGALVEHSTDTITLKGADGRFSYVSPAVHTMLGCTPEQLIGTVCFDLVHPDDLARVTAFHALVITTPARPMTVEYRVVRRDGGVRWLEATETNRLSDLAVAGIIGNVRDITERKLAQQQLRATELQYRRLLETTGEGVVMVDRNGTVVFASARFAALVGREPAELLQRPFAEVFEPSARPALALRMDERRRGIAGFAATTLLHKDGSIRQVLAQSTPMFTDRGDFDGVLAMMSDVTAHKSAEAALRASEARFARLAETGIIGMLVCDLAGRVIDINDAMLQLSGYQRAEVLDPSFVWMQLTPPDWHERDLAVVERLRTHGAIEPYETETLRKDGSRVPVVCGVAMIESERVMVFVIDVSAQKRAEAALAVSEQQLRHAQKLEAMGRLAGGISHDFNNLLSVILSYSEMLIEDLPPGRVLDDMREILEAARRAGELTKQLLVFSRQQPVQRTLLDPAAVVLDLEKMLRRLLGADVALQLTAPPGLHAILIDQGQLEQVVLNLAINARDAMPRGGGLRISVVNVRLDEAFARVHHGVVPGEHVALTVTDTGTGIDPETLTRIFEPFFTTKQVGKGTGLGLANVFGIVQRAGGTIWVESTVGAGTTFTVYLPRALHTDVPAAAPAIVAAAGGTETVLLVEDDVQVRTAAAGILRRSGYHVLLAEHAEDALRIAREHASPIDLLISDVVMPMMSGSELARRVAELRPTIRVLYMSGYTDDITTRHGISESNGVFLPKPLTPVTLRTKVREALAAR